VRSSTIPAMAIDQRPDVSFVPGPPPDTDAAKDRSTVTRATSPAPLRPIDRAWMMTWQERLDPRRHGAVPDTSVVSTLVRERPGTASPGWRYLASAGPAALVADVHLPDPSRPAHPVGTSVERPTDRPAPRSMSVQPVLAYGLSRRTAELLAVLSACLDPAERRADGHAVRVAYLASRIAGELEMGDDARSDLLYAGLLRDAGSTGLEAADHVSPAEGRQRRLPGLSRRTSALPPTPISSSDAPHLSRPDRVAAMVRVLGLPQGVLEAVASAEERWDGRGPRHEKRTAVPTGARVLALAVIAADAAGAGDAAAASVEKALRRERGHTLEPDLVDSVMTLGRGGLWAELGTASVERLLELEPLHRVRHTDDAGLDAIAGAFADLVDTRTPSMGRHGRRVADHAARTSAALGLDPRVADDVRRAALLHDIGKLLVPIAFLEKPQALSAHEQSVVDEHARAGAAVLERSRVLGGLAPLIAAHHARLDGTGLFPAMVDDDRELGARIIALCDRYEAMTADRPYRPALSPTQAWAELRDAAAEPLAGVVLRIMERTLGDR